MQVSPVSPPGPARRLLTPAAGPSHRSSSVVASKAGLDDRIIVDDGMGKLSQLWWHNTLIPA